MLAIPDETNGTPRSESPFHNVVLTRVASRLSAVQALGFHALLGDLGRAAGRSGCSLASIGQPRHRAASPAVNLWWNRHQASYEAVRQRLRHHEAQVLDWILRHCDHRATPDLVAAGREWSEYTDQRMASAACVSRIQALGSTLAELYRIRAPG